MTLVVNGNFESGDFAGWDVHHGKVYIDTNFFTGAEKRKINWSESAPDQPPAVIADSSTLLPTQGTPIAPFEGARMARINDLDGGEHVTCMHQDVVLPADFGSGCAFISFNWGALLGGSNHPELRRPKFEFVVNRKRGKNWKTILKQDFIAPEGNVEGWIDIRKPGDPEAVWYKGGVFKRALVGVVPGDQIRLRFAAEDCTDGAHGGAAFVDNVIVTNGCDVPGAQNAPIAYDALPNVFTPNSDGVNDVWGINNLQGACTVEFTVYDRWGDNVFYHKGNSFDGNWPPFLGIWTGKIRTRRRKRGFGKRKSYYSRMISNKDMDDGVAYFVLKVANCHEWREEPGFIHIFT